MLTKLNQHADALAAFEEAIATAKQSYPMIEAMAYRELANCNVGAAAAEAMAAAQAQAVKDLKEKLNEFDGRLNRAEFDTMSIGLPAAGDHAN